jgi:hypothetical protein
MNIDEGECTIKLKGQDFTARGAYVDDERCWAYINDNGEVQTWHGKRLGTWTTTSEWDMMSRYGYIGKMRAVKITLDDGRHYHGRYSKDWSNLVKARRVVRELRLSTQNSDLSPTEQEAKG